MSTNAIK